ncbi:MAG: hypothetical protein ACTHNK_08935, partial [Thermomicrobiales bacterium]
EIDLPSEWCGGRNSLAVHTYISGKPITKYSSPELAQKHIIGRLVFRVQFHPHALEVLHGVGMTIFQEFLAFVAQWIAIQRQPTVALPVVEEAALNALARFGKALARRLRGASGRGGKPAKEQQAKGCQSDDATLRSHDPPLLPEEYPCPNNRVAGSPHGPHVPTISVVHVQRRACGVAATTVP